MKKETDKLLETVNKKFKSSTKLNFIFLINEQPIAFVNEIPLDCNVIIVSPSPIVKFWGKLAEKYKI